MGARMQPTLGVLLLKGYSLKDQLPKTTFHLLRTLQYKLRLKKNERTLRRYLAVLR